MKQDAIPFEQWLRNNEDLVEKEFEFLGGEIECAECDGTGHVEIQDKDDPAFLSLMRSIYDEQRRRDAKKLEA